MKDFYNPEQRNWQDRHGTRRLADLEVQVIVHDTITAEDKAFIEARDMFFLSTVDERGWPTCSYKGGDPGFVRVLDGKTIAFPAYNGNGMYMSLGNVSANGRVGINQPNPAVTLDVQGTAQTGGLFVQLGVGQGGGLKHERTAISSISPASQATTTITWASGFVDANYTATCTAESSSGNLAVYGITTKPSRASVRVASSNPSTSGNSVRWSPITSSLTISPSPASRAR